MCVPDRSGSCTADVEGAGVGRGEAIAVFEAAGLEISEAAGCIADVGDAGAWMGVASCGLAAGAPLSRAPVCASMAWRRTSILCCAAAWQGGWQENE